MQTNPDDPRVKLMQKWSQNMPAYGMQGATLRAGAGGTGEDDDDDDNERRTSDTRSVMSMQSGRSALSNLFYISGHNEDLKLARAKLHGGGGAPTQKNKKRKGKKNNGQNNGSQSGGTNTNQGGGQNHNHGNNKKKIPKNKAYLTEFKTLTKEEVGKRRTALADKIYEFHQAVDTDLQSLTGELSNYTSIVDQIKEFHRNQSPKLYETIIQALDKMQTELLKKERTDKKLRIDLKRIRPYIVLPVEMDPDAFQARVKAEGNNEKMLLNLHVYFLKICLLFTKHKTMPAKVMEKMTTDKEPIPQYKTKQEDDANYKILYHAWSDAQALKNVYETYTAYIQKTDKSGGKGANFHYIKL